MRSYRLLGASGAFVLAGLGSLAPGYAQGAPEVVASNGAEEADAPPQAIPGYDLGSVREPALAPAAEAFRGTLRAEVADLPEAERAAIEEFYAGRGFEPYWTLAGSGDFTALIAALEESPAHGLPYRRYDPGALAAIFAADPSSTPAVLREVAATRTYLRYAADLNAGILTPSRIDPEISVAPSRPTATVLLAKLGSAPLAGVLAGLEPGTPDYRVLMAEKARLDALAVSEAWGPTVAEGPTLHEGENSPRIAALRARLARLGYGVPSGEVVDSAFDAKLTQSVQSFQRDHGLNDDGAVGRRTLAEINATAQDRLAQVVVNLERLRWQNRDFGARHILVNIPDYAATVFEAGAPVWRTKVVVGEASKTRTPEFSGVMTYMVVNPSWHMPNSIAKRVYLPQLKNDPGLLARSGMQLMTQNGTVIDPALVDFTQLDASFPFRIRQTPSDGNALGKVKFMFPNDFAIYLHDTPHRELFAKDARAFSNGCIRVQDPEALARLLLRGQVSDPRAAFDGWVAARSERTVMLDQPMPVDLVYRTAFVDDGGVVRYRDDVYGRDATVFGALEAAGVTLPAVQG